MIDPTATVTTPATTTETPPAAPAISAPSPSPVASQRPASFQEAFEQVAAQEDKAAAAPLETAATGQAAATDPTGADHPSADKKPLTGAVPTADHVKAVDNARTKAREEVVAEFERDFGWTKDYTRAQVESFAPIAKRITDDPIGHILDLAESLQTHPVHGPRLRSEAARILASRGVSGATAPSLDPDLQVVDDQGHAVTAYSADRVKALIEHAVQDAIGKEVQPLRAEHDKRQAAAKAADTERAIASKADAHLAELLDLLDLTPDAVTKGDPLLAAVSKAMAEHPDWSATKAAVHVRRTQIAPTLEAKAKQKALDDMKTKALGNTVSGTGAATPITKPRTREELRQYMEAHAG